VLSIYIPYIYIIYIHPLGKERKKCRKKVFAVLNRQCQRLGASERALFEAQIWIHSKHRPQHKQHTLSLTHCHSYQSFFYTFKEGRERERRKSKESERERERAELGSSQLHCPLAQNPRKCYPAAVKEIDDSCAPAATS
jgi:hypothetical protein